MPEVVIYHNPRCSKSREALRLLQEAGVTLQVVDYQKTPLDEAEISRLIDLLGLPPRELMRSNEAEYRDLYLDDITLDRHHLVAALVEYPRLLQRPIVVAGTHALIARPPEKVRELLAHLQPG